LLPTSVPFILLLRTELELKVLDHCMNKKVEIQFSALYAFL